MISELLNARGGPVKLYRPAISYISICKGLFGPIRAERELKGTLSELKSKRGGAEQEVAEVDVKSEI
jgi:hypothetical protein